MTFAMSSERVEMDEQWQYVGIHGQRMNHKEPERGDFWLWACVDADTKLVFSHLVGPRKNYTGGMFVDDVAKRVKGPVQIATDKSRSYAANIRDAFGYEGYSYGTETKIFGEPEMLDSVRKNGIPPIVSAERKAAVGSPDLGTLTTCYIERVFLSVQQECTRFTRLTLGYKQRP